MSRTVRRTTKRASPAPGMLTDHAFVAVESAAAVSTAEPPTAIAERGAGLRPGPAQLDMLTPLREREVLFALLSRCMPWSHAAAATDEVLARFGSFADAIAAPEGELAAVPSLGPSGASLLKCLQTASAYLSQMELRKAPVFKQWSKLIEYFNSVMARDKTETARVLYLDTRNKLLADDVVGRGDVKSVAVSTRDIIRRALEVHATAIILAHNHPSGDPRPSDRDIDMTNELIAAAGVFDIVVHDHIIVGREGWFSFRHSGLLGRPR